MERLKVEKGEENWPKSKRPNSIGQHIFRVSWPYLIDLFTFGPIYVFCPYVTIPIQISPSEDFLIFFPGPHFEVSGPIYS